MERNGDGKRMIGDEIVMEKNDRGRNGEEGTVWHNKKETKIP